MLSLVLLLFLLAGFAACKNEKLPAATDKYQETVRDHFYTKYNNDELLKADELKWAKKYLSAATAFEQLILENTLSERHEKIYALNQLIYCCFKTFQKAKAKKYLDQLETLLVGENTDEDLLADFYFNKAQVLIDTQQGEVSLPLLLRADSIYEKTYGAIHLKRLDVLTLLGKTYFQYSDRHDVLEMLFSYLAQAAAQITADSTLGAYAAEYYYWNSFVAFMQRRSDEGLSSADLAIHLIKESPDFIDTSLLALCFSSKGVLYKAKEDSGSAKITSEAARWSLEAVELADTFGKDTAVMQMVYRDLLTYLARIPDTSYFTGTFKKLAALNSSRQYAYPDRLKALWFYRRNDYDRSIAFYQRLLRQLDQGEVVFNRFKLYDEGYFTTSRMFSEKSMLDSAIYYQMKNITFGTPYYEKESYEWSDIVDPKVQNSHLHAFIEYALLAVTFSSNAKSCADETDCLQKAYELFEITDTLIFNYSMMADEEVSLTFLGEQIAAFYPSAVEVCYKLYQKSGDRKYFVATNFFMERMKSFLMYRDMFLAKSKNDVGVPTKYLDKEQALRQELREWKWRLAHSFEEDKKQEARLIIQRCLSEQRALSDQIKKEHPHYFETRMQHDFLPLAAIENYLQNEEPSKVVLQYVLSSGQAYVILNRADTSLIYSLPIPEKMNVLVDAYKELLSKAENSIDAEVFSNYTNLGHELYNILVKPVQDQIPQGAKLLIVPDAKLGQIPFEAFLTKAVNAEKVDYRKLPYLLHDYSISYAPSVKTWLLNQKYKSDLPANPKVLAFAYSKLKPDSWKEIASRSEQLAELPGSAREVEAIREVYTDDANQFFFGEESTKLEFVRSAEKDFDIIHLSLHARADADSYLNNQIYFRRAKAKDLAPDIMYGYEIAALELKAPLVVLSACSTSEGVLQAAEGSFSLMRSFMERGAKTVLASYWSIDDHATSELISKFYTRLHRQEAIGLALQSAKIDYIENANRYFSFPGYWASVGCWE